MPWTAASSKKYHLRVGHAQGCGGAQTNISSLTRRYAPKSLSKPTDLGRQQFLQPDRQLTHTNTRCVIDCVSDCRRRADIAKFADALDTRWIDEAVFLRDENDLKLLDVGIHGNEVVGQIVVDVSGDARVDFSRFMQCGTDAPDHRAHVLAARSAGVHQAAGGEGANNARHADFPGLCVHTYFNEFCAKRVHELLAMGAAAKRRLAGIEIFYGVGLGAGRQKFRVFLDRAKLQPFEGAVEIGAIG